MQEAFDWKRRAVTPTCTHTYTLTHALPLRRHWIDCARTLSSMASRRTTTERPESIARVCASLLGVADGTAMVTVERVVEDVKV